MSEKFCLNWLIFLTDYVFLRNVKIQRIFEREKSCSTIISSNENTFSLTSISIMETAEPAGVSFTRTNWQNEGVWHLRFYRGRYNGTKMLLNVKSPLTEIGLAGWLPSCKCLESHSPHASDLMNISMLVFVSDGGVLHSPGYEVKTN